MNLKLSGKVRTSFVNVGLTITVMLFKPRDGVKSTNKSICTEKKVLGLNHREIEYLEFIF